MPRMTYEIQGCVEDTYGVYVVPDHKAAFWSLYQREHPTKGGFTLAVHVADFPTRGEAHAMCVQLAEAAR